MLKVLKWIGIVLGSLIGLLVIALLVVVGLANYRLNKTYNVSVEPITIPADAAAVERGRYLVNSVTPCTSCHGKNLGGNVLVDDDTIGQIYSPNITTGKGGKTVSYTEVDWVRTIRYGVDPEGKPVFMPPVPHFRYLSDADLGAILAYVKTFPPVDQENPDIKFTLFAQVLFGLGQFGKLPAEIVAESPAPPPAPAPGVNVEYGEYLARVAACRDCHGEDLAGGFAGPPGSPATPDLTQGGELLVWTEADFLKAFRTGVTPSGHQLSEDMPYMEYQMTDDDLTAVFLYLKSLPAVQKDN